MSRRLSFFALCILLAAALAACGTARQSEALDTAEETSAAAAEPTLAPAAEPTAPAEPAAAAAPTASTVEVTPAKDIYAVGDIARLEPFRVNVTDIRLADEVDGSTPEDGNQFVLVDLTLENTGSESQDVALLLQMTLEDSAGENYTVDVGASMSGIMQLNGSIGAGESATGTAGYQVPADARDLRFVFRTLEPGATGEAGRVAFAVES